MTQFWVYILRCRDGSYYTGHTDDLDKRMAEHQQGKGSLWTRTRLPVDLVWCDWAGERYEALAFERRVKNWSRAKKEALIAGDWARVGCFARPPHERPSTSLGTNDGESPAVPSSVGSAQNSEVDSNRDSFVPSAAEGRATDLGDPAPDSFVPSVVEGRATDPGDPAPDSFVPSAAEGRATDLGDPAPDSFVPSVVEGRAPNLRERQ